MPRFTYPGLTPGANLCRRYAAGAWIHSTFMCTRSCDTDSKAQSLRVASGTLRLRSGQAFEVVPFHETVYETGWLC